MLTVGDTTLVGDRLVKTAAAGIVLAESQVFVTTSINMQSITTAQKRFIRPSRVLFRISAGDHTNCLFRARFGAHAAAVTRLPLKREFTIG
jgi:hypothetical protein